MANFVVVKRYALLVSTLVYTTLLLRFYLGIEIAQTAGKNLITGLIDSLGYFTVLTTMLLALALTAGAFASARRYPGHMFFRHPVVISAISTSAIFLAIVYLLLLRNLWQPEGLRYYIDILLHYIIPPLFLFYWWLAVPARSLQFPNVFLWLVYPLMYLLIILLRGAITDSYPYPFIDLAELGLLRVLINSIALLIFFVLIGWLLVWINRLRH